MDKKLFLVTGRAHCSVLGSPCSLTVTKLVWAPDRESAERIFSKFVSDKPRHETSEGYKGSSWAAYDVSADQALE